MTISPLSSQIALKMSGSSPIDPEDRPVSGLRELPKLPTDGDKIAKIITNLGRALRPRLK
jgi:hypothetical protein